MGNAQSQSWHLRRKARSLFPLLRGSVDDLLAGSTERVGDAKRAEKVEEEAGERAPDRGTMLLAPLPSRSCH